MKKAQSLVEFAIVLAVFLLVVMAIIDYSMLNRARWQVETIANEVMANLQEKGDELVEKLQNVINKTEKA